jgi:hypothetical protein
MVVYSDEHQLARSEFDNKVALLLDHKNVRPGVGNNTNIVITVADVTEANATMTWTFSC